MKRLIGLLLALTFLLGIAVAPVAAAKPTATGLTTPVTGSFTDALGGVGSFDGEFTLTRFVNDDGALAAVGTLTGTLTDSLGNILGTITRTITLPVLDLTGTCEILHLELGPIDLDLLGLVVHLDQIVLDITAESGPGNLLGNLLCGIAGLLDGSPLNSLIRALNQLLMLL